MPAAVDNYASKIVELVSELTSNKENIIYLSFNKIPEHIKKKFASHGIKMNKILFISCAGVETEDISVMPDDLTKLSIAISESVKMVKKPVLIVDTISAFSIYHPNNTICKFVSSINEKSAKEDYWVIWVSIEDSNNKRLNESIAPLCDEVIKS